MTDTPQSVTQSATSDPPWLSAAKFFAPYVLAGGVYATIVCTQSRETIFGMAQGLLLAAAALINPKR